MNRPCSTALLALLVALACAPAAAAMRPLQLDLQALPVRPDFSAPSRPPLASRRGASSASLPSAPGVAGGAPPLRERALRSVLESSPATLEDERGAGRMQLKFQSRGNAFRDLKKGYRELCDRASARVWDEPNGKRVRFDVQGRVGVGVEIPLR